jgi:protein PET100
MLRFPLEAFKFSIYLSIPVIATVVYAEPENMQKIVNYTKYIVYPAEGPKPPLGDEMEQQEVTLRLRRQREEMQARVSAKKREVEEAKTGGGGWGRWFGGGSR